MAAGTTWWPSASICLTAATTASPSKSGVGLQKKWTTPQPSVGLTGSVMPPSSRFGVGGHNVDVGRRRHRQCGRLPRLAVGNVRPADVDVHRPARWSGLLEDRELHRQLGLGLVALQRVLVVRLVEADELRAVVHGAVERGPLRSLVDAVD